MASVCFIEVSTHTFYGEYIYDQVIPRNHFFRKLKGPLDWSAAYSQKMIRCIKGAGEYGWPPIDPLVLLKMLLIAAYLYNLSERQVEEYANYTLPAKYSLGLVVGQVAPDCSALIEFYDQLIQRV